MSGTFRKILHLSTIFTCLIGCDFLAGKGGGTETESKVEVAGRAVNTDGSPAVGARVALRPADYLTDPVTPDDSLPRQETITDAQGRFQLSKLPPGAYRLEGSGSESGGFIQDFKIDRDSQTLVLPKATLLARGSIAGTFAPDSEMRLSRFVQVYGMERLVIADPTGAFLIGNLPPGNYDLRFSSTEPFRREAILRGITVVTGKPTPLDAVALIKEAKLAYSVDSVGLKIDGMDKGNPIILDNEFWGDGIEPGYLWTKASLGEVNLRGNIVTSEMVKPIRNTVPAQLVACQGVVRDAHLAGLGHIPDPVAGATERLLMPASGRIEDIVSTRSEGSDLIVAEARKATPEKPLLIVVGGPLTTVAQAYLTDPSIAARMVVAGMYSYTAQTYDTASDYLVARKCRFVQWGGNYSWGGSVDTSRLAAIPQSRLGVKVRAVLLTGKTGMPMGDVAAVAYLFNRACWSTADQSKVTPDLKISLASNITFDFLDIPKAANNWTAYHEEVMSTLADINAYAPYALPGKVEAEAYLGSSAATDLTIDSAAGNFGVTLAPGGWTEYRVSAKVGKGAVVLRYRSSAGAKISVSEAGGPQAQLDLPATAPWSASAQDSVSFSSGTGMLRIQSVSGTLDLDSWEALP